MNCKITCVKLFERNEVSLTQSKPNNCWWRVVDWLNLRLKSGELNLQRNVRNIRLTRFSRVQFVGTLKTEAVNRYSRVEWAIGNGRCAIVNLIRIPFQGSATDTALDVGLCLASVSIVRQSLVLGLSKPATLFSARKQRMAVNMVITYIDPIYYYDATLCSLHTVVGLRYTKKNMSNLIC